MGQGRRGKWLRTCNLASFSPSFPFILYAAFVAREPGAPDARECFVSWRTKDSPSALRFCRATAAWPTDARRGFCTGAGGGVAGLCGTAGGGAAGLCGAEGGAAAPTGSGTPESCPNAASSTNPNPNGAGGGATGVCGAVGGATGLGGHPRPLPPPHSPAPTLHQPSNH